MINTQQVLHLNVGSCHGPGIIHQSQLSNSSYTTTLLRLFPFRSPLHLTHLSYPEPLTSPCLRIPRFRVGLHSISGVLLLKTISPFHLQ